MTFKLNMTDDEANSKDYEYPPTGTYLCRITDITLESVRKTGDNFGKPFWKMTLTVDEGKYAGTPIFVSVMLYDGALFAIKQLCEAVHPEYIDGKNLKLPSLENGMPNPDPWVGQLVGVKGTYFPSGSTVMNGNRKGEIREYEEFKVKYKKPPVVGSKTATGLPLPS